MANVWLEIEEQLANLNLPEADKIALWPLLAAKNSSEALALVTGRFAVPSLQNLLGKLLF